MSSRIAVLASATILAVAGFLPAPALAQVRTVPAVPERTDTSDAALARHPPRAADAATLRSARASHPQMAAARGTSRSAPSLAPRGRAGPSRASARPTLVRRRPAPLVNATRDDGVFSDGASPGRVVLAAPNPGEIGFEGPTTRSSPDGLWCMGTKISFPDAPSDGVNFASFPSPPNLRDVPFSSLADVRPRTSGVTSPLCPESGCSWREIHDASNVPEGRAGDGWFDADLVDYAVARGGAGAETLGSLPNFVAKMTVGRSAADEHTIEPVTDVSGSSFIVDGADLGILEPRENVIGGILSTETCTPEDDAQPGVCFDDPTDAATRVFYAMSGVKLAPSDLRGFPSASHGDLAAAAAISPEFVVVGHFVEDAATAAPRGETTRGVFYVRELEVAPPEPADPADPANPAPATVLIFEGPITWIEPAVGTTTAAEWATLWVMGAPYKIHPDLEIDGPTIPAEGAGEPEPVTGASLHALVAGETDPGRKISIFGATGKGQAVVDSDGVARVVDLVVELAENVVVHPDVSCASPPTFNPGCAAVAGDDLELFPDETGAFQLATTVSADPNFPGGWVDVGGEPLPAGTSLATILPDAPDSAVGLGGYYVVSAEDSSDGAGRGAGTFHVVEGASSWQPVDTVRVARYDLRYDVESGETRMGVRGTYRWDVAGNGGRQIPNNVRARLRLVHRGNTDGGAYATEPLLKNSDPTSTVGSPGIARNVCRDATCTVPCERVPRELPTDPPADTCAFRLDIRVEGIGVRGLDAVLESTPELTTQYIARVFEIRVNFVGRRSAAEHVVAPTRARVTGA